MSVLIIEGEPGKVDLIKTWEQIRKEYLEIIGDKNSSYINELTKDIGLMNFKIDFINLCVRYLSIKPDKNVLDKLKSVVPITGKFDESDYEQYIKDLKRIIDSNRNLLIRIEEKKKELEELIPDEKEQKIDERYFESLIVQVSKYMKFQVVKQTTSVAQFAAMICDMKMAAELLKREYAER